MTEAHTSEQRNRLWHTELSTPGVSHLTMQTCVENVFSMQSLMCSCGHLANGRLGKPSTLTLSFSCTKPGPLFQLHTQIHTTCTCIYTHVYVNTSRLRDTPMHAETHRHTHKIFIHRHLICDYRQSTWRNTHILKFLLVLFSINNLH